MVLLLISWLFIYFLTSTLGYGLLKASWLSQSNTVSQTDLVLAGLTCITVIAQITSFIWPTDYRLIGFFLLLAIITNWRMGNRPVQMAAQRLRYIARQPLFWLLVAVILIFSISIPGYWDAGMYHVPSIRWYERFRVIPGLGNLHGRLAFNSSFFLASSVFAFTDIAGQTLFPINGFTLIVFGAYIINRFRQVDTLLSLGIVQILLLILVLYYLLYPLTSPTPDIWATVLPLFVFLYWLDKPLATNQPHFFLIVALGLLCLTVKLGTIPFLLFLPVLLFVHRRSINFQQGLALVALGVVIVGPWLVRNVILSGYLLYPLSALDLFSVDWKIPQSAVHHEEDFVAFWARFHINEAHINTAMLTWPASRWIPMWWQEQGNPETFSYFRLNRPLFVAACISPLLMAYQAIRFGFRPVQLWVAYGVALAGFLFWFIIAPEFRFGLTAIWMTVLLPLVPLLERLPIQRTRWLFTGALGLFMVYMPVKLIREKHPITERSLLIPNWFGYHDVETEGTHYQPHRTRSGLTVLVPEKKGFDQRCFELEQPCCPCTPYFYEDLEKRGTTFEDGFRRRQSL